MDNRLRKRALAVLNSSEKYSWLRVHNAIIDLRRNSLDGDEKLLQKFLDHEHPMVVAATLFALIYVYKPIAGQFDLLLKLADGDSRDMVEMPIQCHAIQGLAEYAREDERAIPKILSVAQAPTTPDAPRSRAWLCLAKLFGVPWKDDFNEEMILRPESQQCEAIRSNILNAMAERNGQL